MNRSGSHRTHLTGIIKVLIFITHIIIDIINVANILFELTFQKKGISGIQSVTASSSGIVCRESRFVCRLLPK